MRLAFAMSVIQPITEVSTAVRSVEHVTNVQNECFSLGYRWKFWAVRAEEEATQEVDSPTRFRDRGKLKKDNGEWQQRRFANDSCNQTKALLRFYFLAAL